MRITDSTTTEIGNLSSQAASQAQQAGLYGQAGLAGYGQSADRVQLSTASQLAASALANHSAHLSRLREMVASGNYDVSGETVAQSVLDEALSRTALR